MSSRVSAVRRLDVAMPMEKLHGLLQAVPAACAIMRGPTFIFELANVTSQAWMGRGNPVGRKLLDVMPELAGQPEHLAMMRRVYETGETVETKGLPTEILQPDGSLKTLYVNATLQIVPNFPGDNERRLLSFAVDVTSEVLAHQQLVATQKDLERALRQRDEYMSVASHELRTPLTSILLQAQLLKTYGGRAVPAAERIIKHGNRISEMISTLLDVSRLSKGPVPLELEVLDVAQVVGDAVVRLKYEAEKAGCTVQTHLSPMMATLDRSRLEQVATNLLTNAFKYGAGKPVIVCVSRDNGQGMLSVQDFGVGIRAEDQTRIFDQFARLRTSAAPGLGLGLWIVKQLVALMGGTITVSSKPEKGATFTIHLPVVV